jgi:hypothetical protein
MKNTFQTCMIALLGLFFLPNVSFGQLYEVSFDEKIQKSTLIVEGRVVESRCYRADDETIYTANKIKLTNLLKGDFREEYLTITTWGGELEGELQTWSHLLTLNKGEQGIFFLEPTRVPAIKDADYPASFDVYAASQGFVQFVQNDAKALVGHEPFHIYADIPNDLYGYIEQQTGQKSSPLGDGGDEKRSGIRYHFTDIGFQGNAVTFNIYVNSLEGNKKLYKSGIQLGYNPAFFGSNIATNGNLLLQDAGISQSSTYDLAQSNVTSSKVKIELVPVGNVIGLTEITTTEQLLAKGKITIQNLLADPGITYDIAEMQAMSKFYEGGLQQVFDTVIVDGDWRLFEQFVPSITMFFPDTTIAGINNQLTIIGTGFGNVPSSPLPNPTDRRVLFTRTTQPNSPAGQQWMSPLPADYLLWNDSTIIVNVPSVGFSGGNPVLDFHAGTGKIGVVTPLGTDTSFAQKLYVRGTAFNNAAPNQFGNTRSVRYKFLNRNSEGGYDLYYSQAFAGLNGGQSISAFERALVTWRCATGINFRITLFDSIPAANQQYACRISLGTMPVGVLSSATAITIDSLPDACAGSNGIIRFLQVRKFNMIFNDLYDWHTAADTPVLDWSNTIDLETTALHEIGHAHELGHSNNSHNVMWYLVNQYRRSLTNDDIKVGQDIVFYSAVDTSFKCSSPMASVLGLDCAALPIDNIDNKTIHVKVFPNPVSEFANIVFPEEVVGKKASMKIIDQTGRLIESSDFYISGNFLEIDLSNNTSGIYFLILYIENKNPFVAKILKQ